MSKTHITRVTFDPKTGTVRDLRGKIVKDRTDGKRVDALTDEDIKRAAALDPDAHILTARELKTAYRVPQTVDVLHLRQRLRMSQAAFAHKYGFSVDSLQDWEQGRVTPSRSARVLLTVIAREPDAVDRALYGPSPARGQRSRARRVA